MKLPHSGLPPTCPVNGLPARPVSRSTVESLVTSAARTGLVSQPYYFCQAVDCAVVYVSALGDHLVTKDQLTVRVGIKESEDPIPLCYCFGFDRQAIRDDIRLTGSTQIQTVITERVRAGDCRCELTNPSGGCCLGDVARAINQALAMKAQGLL